MAKSAKVIISTVGPYQLYGEGLVGACAAAGTDYVDLCGEPAWMAAMIRKCGDVAKASGARIVFSCGFDSKGLCDFRFLRRVVLPPLTPTRNQLRN